MKVKTLNPVLHNGKPVKVGSVIDVAEGEAEQLVQAGSAELASKHGRDPEKTDDEAAADKGGK